MRNKDGEQSSTVPHRTASRAVDSRSSLTVTLMIVHRLYSLCISGNMFIPDLGAVGRDGKWYRVPRAVQGRLNMLEIICAYLLFQGLESVVLRGQSLLQQSVAGMSPVTRYWVGIFYFLFPCEWVLWVGFLVHPWNNNNNNLWSTRAREIFGFCATT